MTSTLLPHRERESESGEPYIVSSKIALAKEWDLLSSIITLITKEHTWNQVIRLPLFTLIQWAMDALDA